MFGAILKRILIGVAAATFLVIAVGFFLPSTYRVERTTTIHAPVERIHALVNDLERWPEWTPWLQADPTVTVTLGALTSGVGAHQTWTGESGAGQLTFTESSPATGIVYDMSFDEGKHTAVCEMQYRPTADGGTELVWSMTGDNGLNIVSRYFGLVMDSFIGPMFDEGLAKLKLVAETEDSEGMPAEPEPAAG